MIANIINTSEISFLISEHDQDHHGMLCVLPIFFSESKLELHIK